MTLEQLQYFHKIVQEGTFSRAALELHMSQSALSKQIAKLERELNIVLFDRSRRTLTLTPAGITLLKDAEGIIEQYQKMLHHTAMIKEESVHMLRIAMLPVVAQYDITKRINDFKHHNPDIQLIIQEYEECDIATNMNFSNFDMIIIRDGHEQLAGYESARLYQDSLVAIMAKQHPLANAKSVNLHDLAKEELLLPPSYFIMCKIALQVCHKAGFKPTIKRHGRFETIITLAGENQGIALAMKHSLQVFHHPNVKILPFQEPIYSDILLYYTKDSKKVDNIKKFLSFFQI